MREFALLRPSKNLTAALMDVSHLEQSGFSLRVKKS
jgi:hypothetical protein